MDKECVHCDREGFALEHIIKETPHFLTVCDVHPLTEGHLLIIPKRHVSCIGACTQEEFAEFLRLYEEMKAFIANQFGMVATFEHGNTAQTVFHAHFHLLPFGGNTADILHEGEAFGSTTVDTLRKVFQDRGKYLFFSIGSDSWDVDVRVSVPRFFRDRFAQAMGHPERGDTKTMRADPSIMDQANQEIRNLQSRWNAYSSGL